MEIQKLYRIRSGVNWYNGRSGWCMEEHDSPIFTNRSRAEAKMRSELRTTKELSETRKDLPWQVENYAKWCVAEIAEYNLVPV